MIYVAFGAFAGHLRSLHRRDHTFDFSFVDKVIERFQTQGDTEVQRLGSELTDSIQSVLSDDHDA